ncbi:hypothetical protein PSMK_25660 [Phycisphaera mikurensis NBRC 102666]|uniref:Uncharacterized protein n=1 Tax=Phycisphaera mikurensis (strain NBRC 102666 / KCTC 22515 / FYK2301M01) TaxID=1142394 RepID=I0IHI7_PHYMF|nr:hypothetical protein PSMK_25660 [Phycisphaera mikurensis NBRC 102666]
MRQQAAAGPSLGRERWGSTAACKRLTPFEAGAVAGGRAGDDVPREAQDPGAGQRGQPPQPRGNARLFSGAAQRDDTASSLCPPRPPRFRLPPDDRASPQPSGATVGGRGRHHAPLAMVSVK